MPDKKRFISKTLSRCVAEMCPGVRCLEYHVHDTNEVAIIRLVDVTGLELQECVQAILARLEEVA